MTDEHDQYRILIVDDTQAIHRDIRKALGVDYDAFARRDARWGESAGSAGREGTGTSPGNDAFTDRFQALDAAMFGRAAVGEPARKLACDSAFAGARAVELVGAAVDDHEPYAVAVVDLHMPPGWTGIETIQRMWRADGDLEIILCAQQHELGELGGASKTVDISHALGRHDNLLVLVKPFEPCEIHQMIHALAHKWALKRDARAYRRSLELQVQQRTHSLRDASAQLSREIAERERAEGELRAKQRLEAVGRLAAGVAHEVNTPLQCILSYGELALELTADLMTRAAAGSADHAALTRMQEALDSAHVSARRVHNLVRDLQTYSRNANERTQRIDVNEIVRSCVESSAELLGRSHVDLVLAAVPPVIGNAGRLVEVVKHLVSNAAHAVGGGAQGHITVSTATDGDSVYISVTDSGEGIPDSLRDQVFEPFFTTKAVGEGTGLGLSISRNIVLDMGGSIEVAPATSYPGASLRVSLPAADDRERTSTNVEPDTGHRHGVRAIPVIER